MEHQISTAISRGVSSRSDPGRVFPCGPVLRVCSCPPAGPPAVCGGPAGSRLWRTGPPAVCGGPAGSRRHSSQLQRLAQPGLTRRIRPNTRPPPYSLTARYAIRMSAALATASAARMYRQQVMSRRFCSCRRAERSTSRWRAHTRSIRHSSCRTDGTGSGTVQGPLLADWEWLERAVRSARLVRGSSS